MLVPAAVNGAALVLSILGISFQARAGRKKALAILGVVIAGIASLFLLIGLLTGGIETQIPTPSDRIGV